MSGLNKFINKRGASPATPIPPSNAPDDRASAKSLKVPHRKAQASAAQYQHQQHDQYNVQAPGYPPNNTHGTRFNGPGTIPFNQEEGGRGAGFDSEVDDNFEDTRTSDTIGWAESEYEQEHREEYVDHQGDELDQDVDGERNIRGNWGPEGYNEEGHPQGQISRHHSLSPSKVRRLVPTTTDHFNIGHHHQQSEIPIPPNQTKRQNLKKRGRMEDRPQVRKGHAAADVDKFTFYKSGETQPQGAGMLHGMGDADESDAEALEPGSEEAEEEERTPTRQLEEDAENAPQEDYEKILKVPVNPESSSHPSDFTDEELRKMDYSELKSEPWELARERPDFELPETLTGSTIEQRVEHYAYSAAETKWDDQVAFYHSLNTKEWDAAGEHLLSEIGQIFLNLREAKKQKRIKLEKIEAEIEGREKLVRGKSAKIDAKFATMQASGEGLLNTKN